MADDSNPAPPPAADFRKMMVRFTIPPSLQNGQARNEKYGLPVSDADWGDYIVELNLRYQHGMKQAGFDFRALFQAVMGDEANQQRPPQFISKSYYKCILSSEEVLKLVARDEEQAPGHRVIYKVWPDFPVYPLIDHSVTTIKADAARRSYEATGEGIIWAVVDSGVDSKHIHFGDVVGSTVNPYSSTLKDDSVAKLHRDFTQAGGVPQPENYTDPAKFASDMDANIVAALRDEYGHGTHVAGIIAGGLAADTPSDAFHVTQRVYRSAADGQSHTITIEDRKADAEDMRGVAPQCKIISLKVINASGRGATSNIMLALRYIREELNDDPKMLRVHGVNLSVGYEFDAEMFACGQSPICVEVNRLVEAGVVVVVAAGNTGYARLQTDERSTKLSISNTINDPGNADLAITVGSTHRDAPHTYGVSFFSSKGPTGDGRLKPDLVAPGERITSAATPGQLSRLGMANPVNNGKTYIDDSGTSMAAPHVSGAIAAFLSIRREFIQKPREVKQIFLDSATSLGGRERYFQGHGLLDLMRAIQSV